MMTNLFSIFDPSTSILNMNWAMIFIPIVFMMKTTMKTTKMNILLSSIENYLKTEICAMMTSKKKSSIIMMLMTFFFIMVINLSSLMPFNFTITSQISINFPMAMSMWLSFLILGWLKKSKNMLAHLLPTGTPKPLMPIMVLIEMISQIIRPITLSVRLTANMIAGHLLLSLLSNLSMSSKTMFMNSLPILMILSFLEICVSIIQTYVFMTLLTLYSTEIN